MVLFIRSLLIGETMDGFRNLVVVAVGLILGYRLDLMVSLRYHHHCVCGVVIVVAVVVCFADEATATTTTIAAASTPVFITAM